MSKKRGLGRGLGALIPDKGKAENKDGLKVVPIAQIKPNPHQPRTSEFDPEKLQELAASIMEHGLIQPLIVTQDGDNYTLIAGERRWRASQIAGLKEAIVVVKEATPQEMLELALIENIQRDDLNPLEEGEAYRQLIEEFGLTQTQVAKRVGKGRPTIANLVRLLELPDQIKQAVIDGKISGSHARCLLPLPTPEAQANAMSQIMKLNLSVRQTETLVRNLLADKKPTPKPKPTLPPEINALATQFEEQLGTKVDIQKGKKGGKVVIHFYSDEDLNSIYDYIMK